MIRFLELFKTFTEKHFKTSGSEISFYLFKAYFCPGTILNSHLRIILQRNMFVEYFQKFINSQTILWATKLRMQTFTMVIFFKNNKFL